jgi:hypothetical protein
VRPFISHLAQPFQHEFAANLLSALEPMFPASFGEPAAPKAARFACPPCKPAKFCLIYVYLVGVPEPGQKPTASPLPGTCGLQGGRS